MNRHSFLLEEGRKCIEKNMRRGAKLYESAIEFDDNASAMFHLAKILKEGIKEKRKILSGQWGIMNVLLIKKITSARLLTSQMCIE